MAITPTSDTITVLDLVTKMGAGEIQVNPRYQRSGKLWPAKAKSFLIETVLLGMPVPRILLHELSRPVSLHNMDIIDGQQRCSVLFDYRQDKFALTSIVDTEGIRSARFSQL